MREHRILEVGCGRGARLLDFERWGAKRGHLAGIDLIESFVEAARARVPGADVRQGDAAGLPWPRRILRRRPPEHSLLVDPGPGDARGRRR